jgi:exodeoxyribonuclease-3
MTLALLTLNIGNPSVARAERQLEWLQSRDEHVLVLTETSDGKGSELIASRLASAGWDVRFPKPEQGERGVLLAARVALAPRDADFVPYLPTRAELATIDGTDFGIVGVYVPSRDASTPRITRKRRFVDAIVTALHRPRATVLLGDLNVLEPAHRPPRPEFLDWEYGFYDALVDFGWCDAYRLVEPERIEYSWVGPDNDGYRFDHVFIRQALADDVEGCGYIHDTRDRELTDHSAMVLVLSGVAGKEIQVDDALTGDHRALF